MRDLKPVSRPSFLLDGRGSKVLALVVVAIVVAFIKPWGSASTPAPAPSQAVVISPAPSPTPTPTATPTPDPADAFSRAYDPLLFGDHELQPAWGLWPAGYLSTFGFVMHTERSNPPKPASGDHSPSAVSPSDPASPIWPDAIDIPLGNHLLLIGVDTPMGFSVDDIHLTKYLADRRSKDVPIVRPPSPWPSHFTVIGVDGGYGVSRTALWAAGRYRLELVIEPGAIQRSIEIRVEGAPISGPSRPGSSSVP
jgi:hypothetical protein